MVESNNSNNKYFIPIFILVLFSFGVLLLNYKLKNKMEKVKSLELDQLQEMSDLYKIE